MKLLFVTCLIDYKAEVMQLLKKAQIRVFSYMETTGVKNEHDENLMDDWFGSLDGEFKSLVLFSFTSQESAGYARQLIKEYNEDGHNRFPVHAFILSVESE